MHIYIDITVDCFTHLKHYIIHIIQHFRYGDYRRPTRVLRGQGLSKTPDHEVFYHLATSYASNHEYMENATNKCPRWGYFEDGVTNGANW